MQKDDWIVIQGNFRPELRQIVKVTERMVQAIDDPHRKDSWKRPWQCAQTAVLFCGTESRARWLLERLTSSEALYTEENRAALRRKNERQEKYIADALLIETMAAAG